MQRILSATTLGLFLAAAIFLPGGSEAMSVEADLSTKAAASASADQVIEDHYIVVYKSSVGSPSAETESRERALDFESELRYKSALKGFSAELGEDQVANLRADPEVAFVAEDRVARAVAVTPLLSGDDVPFGVRRVGAGTATTTREASGTNVAVIDSGIRLSHPDLNASAGTNCVNPGSSPLDDNGHGTHVAGTIGAKNNASGVVGVAPNTRLYAVKVLDSEGSGSWSQIICGLDWVTANSQTLNIKVANMSLSGSGSNDGSCGSVNHDPLHQAVCRTTAAGVSLVVAAGNDGRDFGQSPGNVPAAYPEALTVTAVSDSDGRPGWEGPEQTCWSGEFDDTAASFTNYATSAADSAHVIAGPGVCIVSTSLNGGYTTMSGTSMASPHIAGEVALCIKEGGVAGPCSGKTAAQVIAHLRAEAAAHNEAETEFGFSGDPLDPNGNRYYGYLSRAPDLTPPNTTISSGPSSTTSSTSASFGFTSNEIRATFECRLDAGAWTGCSSPTSYAGLLDGTHTFRVRATDAAGNADPTEAARTWTVDTPPDTAITSGPSVATNATAATFAFESTEANSTFECRLDAGAWTGCSSPTSYAGLLDGTHTFRVRATDAIGRTDPFAASRTWAVAAMPAPFSLSPVSPPQPVAKPEFPAKARLPGSRKPVKVSSGGVFSYSLGAASGLRGIMTFNTIRPLRNKRTVTLAVQKFRTAPSRKVSLKLTLSKKSLGLLKRERTIKVRVTVRLRNVAGYSSVAASVIYLGTNTATK